MFEGISWKQTSAHHYT